MLLRSSSSSCVGQELIGTALKPSAVSPTIFQPCRLPAGHAESSRRGLKTRAPGLICGPSCSFGGRGCARLFVTTQPALLLLFRLRPLPVELLTQVFF
jgi:hypothetical protein